MTVTVELTTYGGNTVANVGENPPSVKLHRYWNEQTKIVLEINGLKVNVAVDDLRAAISACTAGGDLR